MKVDARANAPTTVQAPTSFPAADRFVAQHSLGTIYSIQTILTRRERAKGLSPMSKIVLPYEPDYVGAEKRRKQTQGWLRQRELEVTSTRPPSIAPSEHTPENEKVK